MRSFKYDPQDASNAYLTADTQYDSLGRVRRVSNPYRSPGCLSAVNPSGRWTTTAYDALGRVTTVTTPDGAVITTSYSGNTVTVTDQAGKSRSSASDALGRLTQVVEAPGAGSCQASGAGCATTYAYDALGNLRKVAQGTQLRYYMYDSLSRLVRARSPEQNVNAALNLTDTYKAPDEPIPNGQWTLGYSYDANSNLYQRTDARNVTTTYQYDNLNRSSTVDYSDTPAINPDIRRYYDNPAAGANGKGRFWYDFAGDYPGSQTGEHTAVDSYDAMGRPTVKRQQFKAGGVWSGHYQTSRQYNRAGAVVSQTYPSGHAVSYSYDAAGRVADFNGQAAFAGNLGDGVQRTYASQVAYDEAGRLREERFGARTPLFHKRAYNVRGQLYDVRLSTYSQAAAPWNWNRGALLNYYSQNELNAPTNEARGNSGPENNGNLKLAQHFVPTDDQISGAGWMSQHYDYDSLNRISYVKEQHNGGAYTGEQHYTYDRFGNRTINTAATWGVGGNNKPFSVDSASNRLGVPGGQTGVMSYDNAGNLTNNTYTGWGGRTYDAENRVIAAWGYSALVGGPFENRYAYDADGRRVRRKTDAGEVWQVCDIDGELLAEYQAGAATILATKEYGYRGGELLVTAASGDDGRLLRFLHKLYVALGRSPNAAELQTGMATLSAAAAQGQPQLLQAGRNIAASIFNSAEYAARGRTDAQFVTDLYWAYPQRQPDPGGHQAWLNAIPTHGRAGVRDGFAYSPEFDSLVARVYGLSTGDDQRTELFIYKLYTSLARDPSAADLAARVARVNTAAVQGRAQVVAEARAIGRELFLSQEYANRNRSNRDFVYDLYVAFLDREPDAGGWDAWTNAVAASGRTAVLDGIAGSGEFDNRASTLHREVFWLVADHLGTPRMTADRSGSLTGVKRHDYLPFGEEVSAGVGGRTQAQGYSQPSGVRHGFTGYEKDGETGLNFAQARYHSPAAGRFTSPDVLFADQHEGDPQSWNLYVYAGNNPLL